MVGSCPDAAVVALYPFPLLSFHPAVEEIGSMSDSGGSVSSIQPKRRP